MCRQLAVWVLSVFHSMGICNKDSRNYEGICCLFVIYMCMYITIYIYTPKRVNVTVERAGLGENTSCSFSPVNYFYNIGIITCNMVQESHEYVCEVRCLAAGVCLLTAVMWLYCGPCTDSCYVTVLWSMYWQLSCDYTVDHVLTAVMWPHFSLPIPSCTFPTVYCKLNLTFPEECRCCDFLGKTNRQEHRRCPFAVWNFCLAPRTCEVLVIKIYKVTWKTINRRTVCP
jgi:hypothetical protein